MTLEIFAVCKRAVFAEDGTTDIQGVFDRITAKSVPVVMPNIAVVIRVRLGFLEPDSGEIRLVLVDPDGRPVHPPVNERYRAEHPAGGSGSIVSGTFNLTNVVFRHPGPHSLVMLVNDRIEGELPIQLKVSPSVVGS